ncbi:(2Fe-2S)-binding protein [filamentous cyanobacterium LEGE 11480]|uniref:(2Fe-2S)-binding protein n=1 Tax=Romeriopsis navalis LEGE 11480 TaxID=2777977 RepID=A0A928Z1T7_9CYAN|nr:(2Fe-2S)-binding protein [Romeriopsis navalis]MBE9029686.1 (2Fe-2S)-binding protein [Romeriopsis navalis LEGE 11480]
MTLCRIHFPGTQFDDMELPPHQPLAEALTVQNSPVLFGCRTGLCGTCVVRAEGCVTPPTADEQEILELYAPDEATARLACQLDVTGDLALCKFEVGA